jgi:hypothetical protein
MNPRKYTVASLATAMVASVMLIASPSANAAEPMPRVLLKGGAAVVGYTWTATAAGRSYPSGTVRRYQWYRGAKNASTSSFHRISGATHARYRVSSADHMHTIKVMVKAYRKGRLVGSTTSAASNYVLLRMAPPKLSGVPHVGRTLRATLGAWADEWNVKLYWRRTGNPIRGKNGLSYRAQPADAGKEISLLAYGDYHYPNGVHPIDRYASRIRINWATKAILKGASRSKGRLGITAIPYAQGAKQSRVKGRLAIYDNGRMVKRIYMKGGRKVFHFKGLRSGRHNIKMVFVSNPWYAGSRTTRTFVVR